jgi:betaine lipid synthase
MGKKLQRIKSNKVTPRTDIAGAHEQGVFVATGSKLSKQKPAWQQKRMFLIALAGAALIASDWIPATWYLGSLKRSVISTYTNLAYLPSGLQFVVMVSLFLLGYWAVTVGQPHLQFAYNCFIKPFLHKSPAGVDAQDHQTRLEKFYAGQAGVYDVTRRRLLRGRSTMLKLCAAQLRQVYPCEVSKFKGDRYGFHVDDVTLSPPLTPSQVYCAGKRFAWIDVGGGTGENIERMNQFFPISNFEKVYLVDITPSLCEVARQRFERLGWKNVKVLCLDAAQFEIPSEDGEDLEIALITMSYSLSMIESFYPIVDRLQQVLAPTGIFGVSDFYVSPKRSSDPTRQLSWLMRWFWAIWFDLDNVYLTPGRREYLEHKFKTVKQISGRNQFIRPIVSIPYYVWIGAQKVSLPGLDSLANFSLNSMANLVKDPLPIPAVSDILSDDEPEESPVASSQASPVISYNLHVSSDHIHGQGYRWRQPFDPSLIDRFSTYIYAFAWEDPRVDLKFLELKKNDHMFVITSGGCNVLEYAATVGPER